MIAHLVAPTVLMELLALHAMKAISWSLDNIGLLRMIGKCFRETNASIAVQLVTTLDTEWVPAVLIWVKVYKIPMGTQDVLHAPLDATTVPVPLLALTVLLVAQIVPMETLVWHARIISISLLLDNTGLMGAGKSLKATNAWQTVQLVTTLDMEWVRGVVIWDKVYKIQMVIQDVMNVLLNVLVVLATLLAQAVSSPILFPMASVF